MKRAQETSRTTLNATTFALYGSQKEKREKEPEKIFEEIIVKNFPNIGKEIATQDEEAQRVPYRINPRRNTPRCIVTKLAKIKVKEKLLKRAREK